MTAAVYLPLISKNTELKKNNVSEQRFAFNFYQICARILALTDSDIYARSNFFYKRSIT